MVVETMELLKQRFSAKDSISVMLKILETPLETRIPTLASIAENIEYALLDLNDGDELKDYMQTALIEARSQIERYYSDGFNSADIGGIN